MVAMTRRLHMGCGETLQSHLPDSFKELIKATQRRQASSSSRQQLVNRKGQNRK